jgi:hypothetical protein
VRNDAKQLIGNRPASGQPAGVLFAGVLALAAKFAPGLIAQGKLARFRMRSPVGPMIRLGFVEIRELVAARGDLLLRRLVHGWVLELAMGRERQIRAAQQI